MPLSATTSLSPWRKILYSSRTSTMGRVGWLAASGINLVAIDGRALAESGDQLVRNRARFAIGDLAAIEFDHRDCFGGRAGQENFIGIHHLEAGKGFFGHGVAEEPF